MKKLLISIGLLLACLGIQAQDYATATISSANTLTSVLATKAKITKWTLTATTANPTTFKLYDMSTTTSSNVVYPATVKLVSYSTNYSVAITNIDGVKLTNTFSGVYNAWVTDSAVTTERPRTITVTVPASGSRTIDATRYLKFGLVAQADQAGLVEVEYDANQQ